MATVADMPEESGRMARVRAGPRLPGTALAGGNGAAGPAAAGTGADGLARRDEGRGLRYQVMGGLPSAVERAGPGDQRF
jgi:hypothetical protein